jgi:hypothetical protein
MAKPLRFDASREVPEQLLLEIFHSLLRLRAQTDPHHGQSSAIDKRKRAIEATDLGMHLVRGLAGWAVDQIAGSELAPDEDPNLHKHEFAGRSISNRDFVADPKRYRLALAGVFRSLANLLPEGTAKALSEAMRALNMGEVRPILAPLATGEHGKAYTVWRRRKEAVLRYEYLKEKHRVQGQRKTLKDLRKKVAKAFGMDVETHDLDETLRSWPAQLRKKFGKWTIDWEIKAARIAGQLVAGAKPSGVDEELMAKALRLKRRFRRLSLEAAGKRYGNPEERKRRGTRGQATKKTKAV